MDRPKFITDGERKKCRKVVEVFEQDLVKEGIVVLDAGGYGFVKLQYYKYPSGFGSMVNYTDSHELFDALWNEWLHSRLLLIARGTPSQEQDYEEIFGLLPDEKQKELTDRRFYFAGKSGIALMEDKDNTDNAGQDTDTDTDLNMFGDRLLELISESGCMEIVINTGESSPDSTITVKVTGGGLYEIKWKKIGEEGSMV